MKNVRMTFFGLAFSLILLAGCIQTGVATPEPVTISIAGSTEMLPVLSELTAEFGRRHPHVLFSLRGGGSTLGESWVAGRQVELAASTLFYDDRLLPPSVVRIPIALDGIAVITHATNAVEDLTLLQLRAIYSGRSLDWQDVGGVTGEILLVSREDGSGARRLFEERVMNEDQVALTAVVMPTSKDVVQYVATHPQAIGYVSQVYVNPTQATTDAQRAALARVKMIQVEGVFPTREATAAQQYHLSRPLFLLRRTDNRGWPQQFIDFVLSPAGQAIVGRHHTRVR
jgi:phosphate transport system substrate-binding protein